jgi:DNA modification methylase
MAAAKRVLKRDGTLFLNLGDTYYSGKGEPKGADKKSSKRRFGLRAVDASGLGVPPKTIIGIPWRVALAMIEAGWILRAPIVWERKDCLSEPSAKDRPWRTYEYVFMFAKSRHYYFSREALQGHEDVWRIAARTKINGLRTAPFPDQLVKRCLSVGCVEGGRVLDPFAGSGTALRVALEVGRHAVGIDLSPDFCEYAAEHLLRA